ncbi:MAG TPA: type II secretion system protein [bacterium]
MMRPERLRRCPPGQRGFTIIETVMSTALLGVLVLSALGGLLFGITQARGGQNRAQAATWAEAEMSYLLLQGYAGLSAQTYTLTQTTGYHNFGNLAEPTLPAGIDHAVVAISAVTGVSVWQVTITLYQIPSTVYTTISTYVSNFTKCAGC